MQNKGIVIWLILLTIYILWHDVQAFRNLEARKSFYADQKKRFDSIETFVNGPLNERISHIEKYLDDNWGEKQNQP